MTALLSLALGSLTFLGTEALFLGEAQAEEIELSFQVDQRVQAGKEAPRFRFQAPLAMREVSLTVQRPGWNQTQELGDLSRGQWSELRLQQSAGRQDYRATIKGMNLTGEELTFELQFSVVVVEEIQIEVLRDDVDLGLRRVPVRINRPVERLALEIVDENGDRFVRREESKGGRQGEFLITWEEEREVGSIQITAHDVDGYWASMVLTPYYIEIPHESVRFPTASAEITAEETPKLRAALETLRKEMEERSQEDEEMQLYIAGYTDTVGSASNNLRLSTQRARALARWFKEEGIEIPIYYQGFGQEVLAVETPDQTEEAANRRAIYLLGNTPPPTSTPFPRRDWARLR